MGEEKRGRRGRRGEEKEKRRGELGGGWGPSFFMEI